MTAHALCGLSAALLVWISAWTQGAPAKPLPAAIVVLFDVSASLDGVYGRGKATTDLAAAMDAWLAAKPALEGRWRLGRFARELRIDPAWSESVSALRASASKLLAIGDEQRYGPSPVWDAADDALTVLEAETGRKGVILITDGRSTGNRHSLNDVIGHAVRAKIAINVIGPAEEEQFALDRSSILLVSPAIALQALVEKTGGRYLQGLAPRGRGPASDSTGESLGTMLDRVAETIRTQNQRTPNP